MPKALRVIDAVADFVESKNTPGSGGRFAFKFKAAIEKLAIPDVQYSLCNHHVLATLNILAVILTIGSLFLK